MNAVRLAGLEPAGVYGYFEKLCSIPHGSRNTKAISDYLVSFAKDHHLKYVQDSSNNVIIYQPGTPGYEDHPTVILQGHMDMVCEKDPDCKKDMETEGLDVTHDDTCVFAEGTTLGGDDGIAVAYALAVLDDPAIAHPPLEVVITVDEEIGMLGADALDPELLKGRRMLNIDSEEEGIFTVSCAGGATAEISLPAKRRAVYGPCVKLTVEGLQGGHSGAEIHKNRGNANKIMGEFLGRIQKMMPLCLTSISGGSKDNAIPRSCQVNLVAMGINLQRINEVAEDLQKEVREKYDEPNAVVKGDDVDALGGNAMTTQDTAKVIAILCASPNGVQAMSDVMPGLVQTSLNLGIVSMDENVKFTYSVRSSVNQEKLDLLKKLEDLAKFNDASFEESGDYPAWEYREESHLRDVLNEAYRKLYHKEPVTMAIHAGLECGLFSDRLPGLDCISIGPEMHDVHTSREKLDIESVKRTWELVKTALAML